jgi:hypothetical protein
MKQETSCWRSYRNSRTLRPTTRRRFLHTDHAEWQAFLVIIEDKIYLDKEAPGFLKSTSAGDSAF